MERAEGLEPQVTPRQRWPLLSFAGWPGKGLARLALLWKSGLPGKWIPEELCSQAGDGRNWRLRVWGS